MDDKKTYGKPRMMIISFHNCYNCYSVFVTRATKNMMIKERKSRNDDLTCTLTDQQQQQQV